MFTFLKQENYINPILFFLVGAFSGLLSSWIVFGWMVFNDGFIFYMPGLIFGLILVVLVKIRSKYTVSFLKLFLFVVISTAIYNGSVWIYIFHGRFFAGALGALVLFGAIIFIFGRIEMDKKTYSSLVIGVLLCGAVSFLTLPIDVLSSSTPFFLVLFLFPTWQAIAGGTIGYLLNKELS